MKLENYGYLIALAGAKNSDRKVPPRHPLQRLWRLYQFSEEIIQLHFYQSNMKPKRIDALRDLIKTWPWFLTLDGRAQADDIYPAAHKLKLFTVELVLGPFSISVDSIICLKAEIIFWFYRDLEEHTNGIWPLTSHSQSIFLIEWILPFRRHFHMKLQQ